jgi:phosphopentomutase
LQIAAHEAVIPLGELYRFCALAREKVMVGEHAVARIIARPFHGENGRYARTPDRKDFSLPPPDGTLLDRLADAMIPVFAVGKIGELFAGRGITESLKTRSNREGIEATLSLMKRPADGLVFVNLVDFDTAYGHRLDPAGFARALEEFDEAVDELIGRTRHDDMLVITADHGNDPTVRSTDHSREHVPLLVCWPRGRRGVDLGVRATFADLGATLADVFRVRPTPAGESFLHAIR